MRLTPLTSLLILTACGTSPERRAIEKRNFLSQHKAFAAGPTRKLALAKTGGECAAAVDPLIDEAKSAIGELDNAVGGANSTLDASTLGSAAMIAAMLAAQQQQQQPGNSPSTTPPKGIVQPSVVDPVAGAPVAQPGQGGFGDGSSPSHGVAPPAGPANGGDSTIAHTEGGGTGPRDGVVGGVGTGTTGNGGGSRDTINGGAGGGGDAIVGHVQSIAGARTESVNKPGSSSEPDAGGGGGGGGSSTFANSGADLVPESAAAFRRPASAIASLDSAADVAVQHGPGIFSLTTQTYSRFCQRQNLDACTRH